MCICEIVNIDTMSLGFTNVVTLHIFVPSFQEQICCVVLVNGNLKRVCTF